MARTHEQLMKIAHSRPGVKAAYDALSEEFDLLEKKLKHSYDDNLQKQRIDQLNQAIKVGLTQLKSGRKISAIESYQRLKKKIKNFSTNRE